MQAITTYYLSATDTLGARIKAASVAGSITLSWDHSETVIENHERALYALVSRFGWHPRTYAGAELAAGTRVWAPVMPDNVVVVE